jgi:nickel-dependent lactate racemase
VVTYDGLAGVYAGSPEASWQAASELSAQLHVVYVDRPFRRVLCVMPRMYDDLWTAAKGMYKMEPAVAGGGEVIIYAPHITEISYTHGHIIDQVGYHVRDYFVKQWDRFKDYPWGVLAHSTHVRGIGTYDAEAGLERPRIGVTLATGIPEERCQRVNLGYLDPGSIDVGAWRGREDEGLLLVPKAGELLYRLRE